MVEERIGKPRAWLLAARPKTLPAAVVPVIVGSAVAWSTGGFAVLPAAVALMCSLLIQIGTNFANDYFDFFKGADTKERIGPVRVVQSGLIAPNEIKLAMTGVFSTAFVLGMFLVYRGGLPVLIIGVASLICAVIYTAGPWSLAYHGLGEPFAFIFFGPVAVTGTTYVQTLQWPTQAFLASVPIGALIAAILVVNNYRDIDTDKTAGKRTLAVRIGRKATRAEYLALLSAAYPIPVYQAMTGGRMVLLLPLATIPIAVKLVRIVWNSTDGAVLNNALALTGKFLAVFGLLYSIGFII
jgi:1,4-dihydroxy-2-naphthoate octaprenyltransferase